jgi:hypothetical protein
VSSMVEIMSRVCINSCFGQNTLPSFGARRQAHLEMARDKRLSLLSDVHDRFLLYGLLPAKYQCSYAVPISTPMYRGLRSASDGHTCSTRLLQLAACQYEPTFLTVENTITINIAVYERLPRFPMAPPSNLMHRDDK